MARLRETAVMALVVGLVFVDASADPGPTTRPQIMLPHDGDVFGEGGQWDRQYAHEALAIFNDLKPDPTWVARLKALPDNTWLECKPVGGQQPETWRSEVPMIYVPAVEACFFCCGCTSPGYSSDAWMYKTGANRWVQMWPNYIKGSSGDKRNRGPMPTDRPATRCSLGLAFDSDRGKVVLRGGANSGNLARITWDYDPAANQWEQVAPANTGPPRGADNCTGFIPGVGVVELGMGKAAELWRFRPANKDWQVLPLADGAVGPPGGGNSRLVWADGPKRLIYWSNNTDELWAFDPQARTWQNLTPKQGERPTGFYRQGICYDSANNVIIMYGSKAANNNSQGPWVYSFATGSWQDMQPKAGPTQNNQQLLMCYDSKYNVAVIAGSSRGTWVYRYKQASERPRP